MRRNTEPIRLSIARYFASLNLLLLIQTKKPEEIWQKIRITSQKKEKGMKYLSIRTLGARAHCIFVLSIVLVLAGAGHAQKDAAFDFCIQDDSGSPILRLNSTTAQYQFEGCDGVFLAGFGSLNRVGSSINFSFVNGDFKGGVSIDTSGKTATGFVRNRITGVNAYTINDSNYVKGNTCSCS